MAEVHTCRYSRSDSGIGSSDTELGSFKSSIQMTHTSSSSTSRSNSSVDSSPCLRPSESGSSLFPPVFDDSNSAVSSEGSSRPSSVSCSPSLEASRSEHLESADELRLPSSRFRTGGYGPSRKEIARYAAEVIRQEAEALLDLASRIEDDREEADREEGRDMWGTKEVGSRFDPAVNVHLSSPVRPAKRKFSMVGDHSNSSESFTHTIELLAGLPPHGKVVITGLGKSGLLGRKTVATLNSLGIPSTFLHPVEALHGDIGVLSRCPECLGNSPGSHNNNNNNNPYAFSTLSEDRLGDTGFDGRHRGCDAVIMISHSGSTSELVSILPLLRQRARFLIAVTASKESPLAQSSNGWLDARSASLPSNTSLDPDLGTMARLAEADPHVPAPTSSVVVALGVLDAMSLALMRVRVGMWGTPDEGYEGEERKMLFGMNHPGGELGKKLVVVDGIVKG